MWLPEAFLAATPWVGRAFQLRLWGGWWQKVPLRWDSARPVAPTLGHRDHQHRGTAGHFPSALERRGHPATRAGNCTERRGVRRDSLPRGLHQEAWTSHGRAWARQPLPEFQHKGWQFPPEGDRQEEGVKPTCEV